MALKGPNLTPLRISELPWIANGGGRLSLNDQTHVLVVGASGRFIARSALRAGCAVSVVDLFGDADTAAICDQSIAFSSSRQQPMAIRCRSLQEFALELARTKRKPDEALWSSLVELLAGPSVVVLGGGGENCPALFESRFYPHAMVAGATPASIQNLLDLDAVIACCERHRIAMPPMITSSGQVAANDVVWLKKQIRSGGGLQIQRWDGESPVDFESGFYLQRELNGRIVSGCFVAAAEGESTKSCLLGVCAGHDRRSQTDFRYTGSYGPISIQSKQFREMERVGAAIADWFDLRGVFGIDFVDSLDGVMLIDINPRITASAELVERFYRESDSQFSIVGAHLRACLDSELPRMVRCSRCDAEDDDQNKGGSWFSKRIVYHDGNDPIAISLEVSNRLSAADDITDIPSPGTIVQPHAPLITVHGQGSDAASVENKKMAAMKLLEEIVGTSLL